MRVAGASSTLGFTILIWFTLLSLCRSVNVYSRFRVQMGVGPTTRKGNTGGSCEGVDVDLQAIYSEAIDMAVKAIEAIDDYATNQIVRGTLKSFFGIHEDPSSPTLVAADSVHLFNTVRNKYQMIIDDSRNTHDGLRPSLFCSGKWTWETRWEYDLKTGKKTGELIEDHRVGKTTLNWSPLFKNYVGQGSGGGETCTPRTLAYTLRLATSITFCPFSFNMPDRKDTLAHYRDGGTRLIKDGTKLITLMSTAGTFLHEICHMVDTGCVDEVIEGTVAYGPRLVGRLAVSDPHAAVRNADSYRWFATAMYLNTHDWSRVISGKPIRQENPSKRSNNSSRVNGYKHGYLKRRARVPGNLKAHPSLEELKDVEDLWSENF